MQDSRIKLCVPTYRQKRRRGLFVRIGDWITGPLDRLFLFIMEG